MMEATTRTTTKKQFPAKMSKPGWWFLTYVLFLHVFTSTNREIIQFDERVRIFFFNRNDQLASWLVNLPCLTYPP